MKRLILVVVCLALCFALCGCSESYQERKDREFEIAQSAYNDGYNDGYDNGYDDGIDVGRGEGHSVGYDEGFDDGYSWGQFDALENLSYTGKDIVWKETPNSTCFSYVGYDSEYDKLALIFRSSETRTYVYSDFTKEDYQKFMAADSLGSYYNKNIKGKYQCQRIDDTKGTYFEP